ncbi:MAG: LytTR family transcriptional regulator DNA-binding domain-containing protein [Eubacterium sp.]|nr:LytTR family transcriptional regulator DNA-binding domain-containing protein [Eubacterium sp.]
MIDVFICEENKNDSIIIKNGCTEYYLNQNYDSEIYECRDSNDLIEKVNNYELTAIYFLDCEEVNNLMIERLQQSAKGSYLVLMAKDMKKILETISPSLRPSGYLLLPANAEEIKHLLKSICNEYENITGESACFRFKIKSRIYSVDISNIDYFEAANKKMILRTVNQEFEYYDNFENVKAFLPDSFLRIHKSFLVNMNNVKNIDFKEMWMSFNDGAVAYISRGYKKDVEDYLNR